MKTDWNIVCFPPASNEHSTARIGWQISVATVACHTMSDYSEYEERIFHHAPGLTVNETTAMRCLVKGTEFQLRVWRALVELPAGQIVSYRDVATEIGSPAACRAVGSAVGQNAIAYLIPCHRVIRESGVVGDYRWGRTRKQILIAKELTQADRTVD